MTETSVHDSLENKGAELLRLHRDPTLLTVVNVWDVISAKVVADTPGTSALATASHSIAASLGYEDGENIPRRGDDRGGAPHRRGDHAARSPPTSRAGTATRPRRSARPSVSAWWARTSRTRCGRWTRPWPT